MVYCRVFAIFTLGLLLAGCGVSSTEPEAVDQPTAQSFVADSISNSDADYDTGGYRFSHTD